MNQSGLKTRALNEQHKTEKIIIKNVLCIIVCIKRSTHPPNCLFSLENETLKISKTPKLKKLFNFYYA